MSSRSADGPVRDLATALRIEWLKLRRAGVTIVGTLALLVIVPTVAVLAPRLAAGDAAPGSAGAKAQALLVGEGWAAVVGFGGQLLGPLGLLVFGIAAGWCVGREFTDGTAVNLFGRPVGRRTVALAKCLLLLVWAAATAWAVALVVAIGGIATGLSVAGALGAWRLGVLGMLMMAGILPVAWVATATRGYLAAIGTSIGVLVVTQFAVILGGGPWVPWAAPALWAGAAGPAQAASVTTVQLALPALLGIGAVLATTGAWGRLQLGRTG